MKIYLVRHATPMKYSSENYKTKEEKQLINEKIVLSVYGEKQAELLSKMEELQNINLVIS